MTVHKLETAPMPIEMLASAPGHPAWCDRPRLPAEHQHAMNVGTVDLGEDEQIDVCVVGRGDGLGPVVALDVMTLTGAVTTELASTRHVRALAAHLLEAADITDGIVAIDAGRR